MNKSIFIVEDDATTVERLRHNIEEMGYQFAGKADNATYALERIAYSKPDLVLMDIHLNGAMDGIQLAELLRTQDSSVAVIYLTAYSDNAILDRAKLTEPLAFLLKPFSKQELKAAIEMGLYKIDIKSRQQRFFDAVVFGYTELVKLHDPLLNSAQARTAELAAAIASQLHLSIREVDGIRMAAMLHKIGLVGMPFELICRANGHGEQPPQIMNLAMPAPPLSTFPPQAGARADESLREFHSSELLESEKSYFQTYPEIAFNILKNIEFPYPVAEVVYQHREKLDGSGFPRGLKEDAILPGARIVAVACFITDKLMARNSEVEVNITEVLAELEQEKGTLFDTAAVDACQNLFIEQGYTLRSA